MSSITETKCGIWSIENALNGAISQCWQYAGDVREPGQLWTWGQGGSGRLGINQGDLYKSSPIQIPGDQWIQAVAGNFAGAAIKSDNTLWSWGYNGQGALGDNTSISKTNLFQLRIININGFL
jgi:alpha-tubulin suppressor-like RCC1 family protein